MHVIPADSPVGRLERRMEIGGLDSGNELIMGDFFPQSNRTRVEGSFQPAKSNACRAKGEERKSRTNRT